MNNIVSSPSKVTIVFDHRVPAESPKTASNQKKVREFTKKFQTALRKRIDQIQSKYKRQVSRLVKVLPAELAICIYRVVQESLSNIARHARASQVEVELICDDDLVYLSVRDNGMGFDAAALAHTGTHLGLLSMKERVRLAKGRLDIDSTPGQGTHVRVEIPHDMETSHV